VRREGRGVPGGMRGQVQQLGGVVPRSARPTAHGGDGGAAFTVAQSEGVDDAARRGIDADLQPAAKVDPVAVDRRPLRLLPTL
jgi:hypothetical protein